MNSISGQITLADFMAAQKLHRIKSVTRVYWIAGAFFVIGILVYLFNHWGIIGMGGGVGMLISLLVQEKLIMPRRFSRTYQQQKSLAYVFTYTWDDEYIEAQSEQGQSKRSWSNYLKYREDKELYLLYHTDNLFEMLPKRWFQSAAQIEQFKQSLRKHVSCT